MRVGVQEAWYKPTHTLEVLMQCFNGHGGLLRVRGVVSQQKG